MTGLARRLEAGGADTASQRRGVILVLTAAAMIGVLAFVAFTVDVGYIAVTKAELQNSADAAALAAAWELLDERRLESLPVVFQQARDAAITYAATNRVGGLSLLLSPGDETDGDLVFGRQAPNAPFTAGGPLSQVNSVRVRVRRTEDQNGALPLFFAPLIGINTADISAEAIAAFRDGIVGYRTPRGGGTVSLIPFTLHLSCWEKLLQGDGPDVWTYDKVTHTVRPGADGIPEMQIFPQDGLPPGNFGALRLGPPSGGNGRLIQQLRAGGLSAEDLDYYGGELRIDPESGSILLGGDTGLTTGILQACASIIGRPVSIAIHTETVGTGINSVYTVVGFAGVRIMSVEPTGASKHVIVQPAVVVDDDAISDEGTSWTIYQPVKLTQ